MYIVHTQASDLNQYNQYIVHDVQNYVLPTDITHVMENTPTVFDTNFLPEPKVESTTTGYVLNETLGSSLGEIMFPAPNYEVKTEPPEYEETVGDILTKHSPGCKLRVEITNIVSLASHTGEATSDAQYSSDSTIILGQEGTNVTPPEPNISDDPARSQDETIESQDIMASVDPVGHNSFNLNELGHGIIGDSSGSQDGTAAPSMTVGASGSMEHESTVPSAHSSEASQDETNASMFVNMSQDITDVPDTSVPITVPETGSNTTTSTDAFSEGATLNVTLPSQNSITQDDNDSMIIHPSASVTPKSRIVLS